MNKKIINYIIIFILLVSFCISKIVLQCSKESNTSKESTQKTKIEGISLERILDAYVNIENLLIWEEVCVLEKRYKDVKNMPIREHQSVEIYKSLDCKNKEIIFYFLVKDNGNTSYPYIIRSLSYSLVNDAFSSGGGLIFEINRSEAEKTLKEKSAIYERKEYIEYPLPFFQKYDITEQKRKILNVLKTYINQNGKKWVEKGTYQVYIQDFSDADLGTEVMLLKKKEFYIIPVCFEFDDRQKIEINVPLEGDIEKLSDYDCGGIQYVELFSKLSIEKFEYKNL